MSCCSHSQSIPLSTPHVPDQVEVSLILSWSSPAKLSCSSLPAHQPCMLSLLSHQIPDLPTQRDCCSLALCKSCLGNLSWTHHSWLLPRKLCPPLLNSALVTVHLQVLKAICGHRNPRHHQSGQDSQHQPPLPQQARRTWSSHTTNIPMWGERGLQARIFKESLAGQAKVPPAVKAHEAAEPTPNHPGEVTHSLKFCPQRSCVTQHEKPGTFPACGCTWGLPDLGRRAKGIFTTREAQIFVTSGNSLLAESRNSALLPAARWQPSLSAYLSALLQFPGKHKRNKEVAFF